MSPEPHVAASFWNLSQSALTAELDAQTNGLTSTQARSRLLRYGPNQLQVRRERALLLQFLARFKNPLVIVLLAASAVSALSGEATSFIIISAIVLFSVTLDFVQEYRANSAAERLKQSVAVRATVLRDGAPQERPLQELVPGDVILLGAGDLVPGDGRVLDAKDFFVNQALLTGEAFPIEKFARDLPAASADLSDATNAVFMGTSVVSGTARVLIARTGAGTALGGISALLQTQAPPNEFERGTRRFGLLIMRLTILLVLFVLLVNTVVQRPLLESFLFAVALAVGLTPELLPMIVSVTLARGAMRLAKRHVITKRLAAIQNLGSMDVLCTDKTGTLTEARIRLERHVDVHGRDSARVLQLVYLNSFFETGLRSPLDTAILEHTEIDVRAWRKIDEVPFDFERRRVSVLVDDGRERLLVVKGAPEDVLRLCTHYTDDGLASARPLDAALRVQLQTLCDQLGNDGFRVLGVAWRQVATDHPHAVVDDESELVCAGFAAFLDPPKASAAPALRALATDGVAVKIVTGDSEQVTRHVCKELNLPITGVLTGHDVQALDDAALQAQAENVNLFCRVTPAQKNRVILALKARGHTVGYLGDGVNDAPALHSADVGISVEGAVDVAKEAADMILLKRDLHVLHDGVREGRRTFGNVMKYIMMGTSSNFGNMFSMAGATLFLPFLPMLPMQVLLNNLLYDLSEIPLPMDRVDPDYLRRPQHWDMNFIRNFMWTVGPISSLFDFLTFALLLWVFQAGEQLFHTGWFIESVVSQVLVIFIIRTHGRPWRSKPSMLLVFAALTVVACALALPFTPLGVYLGFTPPPTLFFAILPVMLVCYLFAVEIAKHWFYARHVKTLGRTRSR